MSQEKPDYIFTPKFWGYNYQKALDENGKLRQENAKLKVQIERAIIELKAYEDNSDRCFCNVIAVLEGKVDLSRVAPEAVAPLKEG